MRPKQTTKLYAIRKMRITCNHLIIQRIQDHDLGMPADRDGRAKLLIKLDCRLGRSGRI
jgi:hypothetical protein